MMKTKVSSIIFIFTITFLSIFSIGTTRADDESYGWGMMRGGYGGYGMMGGGYGGMGPGMMGGYGGYGMMGPGMMGGYGGMINLTEDQRNKIENIQRSMRKSHFAMMEQILAEREKLPQLYSSEKLDAKKIGAVYGRIFAIQRQMIESGVAAHNQMNNILTKEQREQIQQWHRGMWGGGYGPRGQMRNPENMHRGPGMMNQ